MSARGAPALRELQQLVWRLVVAPEGVERGVAALRDEGVLESDDLSFLVRGDARMGSVERLDVYADMYFYRLRDCLADDFPRIRVLLGAERFHDLATDYVLAHPSRHFSLREFGRALPGFLATHRLAREVPDLADLARLEWARVDVFDADDAEPLTRQRLLERAAADPATFAFRLAPATRLVRVAAPVPALWKRLEGDAEEGEEEDDDGHVDRDERCAVLVWRAGRSILHRSLAPDEGSCLEAASAQSTSVARLGEILLARAETPERVSERLAGLLERWSRDAILVEAGTASHAGGI